MYLCSSCKKVSESVMAVVGEYTQIHWLCQYCNTLVCRAFGQVYTIDNLTNAVQSRLSETLSQKLQSIEEKFKNLENTCSNLSNFVSHSEDFDSSMASPTHHPLSNGLNSTTEVLTSFINEQKERNRKRGTEGG